MLDFSLVLWWPVDCLFHQGEQARPRMDGRPARDQSGGGCLVVAGWDACTPRGAEAEPRRTEKGEGEAASGCGEGLRRGCLGMRRRDGKRQSMGV